MKKFRLFLVLLAITAAIAVAGCSDDDDDSSLIPGDVAVTGVSMNQDTLTIKLTNSAQLEATVSPADATDTDVTWSSSDETKATVDIDGLVTGVGAGTATITVTTVDGGFTDTCAVTVKPILYGATHGNGTLGVSVLYELDPDTGAEISEIGETGYYLNGLAYDDVGGKLYGTTSDNDPVFYAGLVEINTSTGEGTPIGSSNENMGINMPTFNSSGELYGWSEWRDPDDYDDPITINKTTGVATVIGEAGIETMEQGMDFNSMDELIFVNTWDDDGVDWWVPVYSIDTTTGAATYIKDIITSEDHPLAHHGGFHPLTGLFWGIDVTAWDDYGPTELRSFNILDIDAGSLVDTIPTINNLHTMAFRSR